MSKALSLDEEDDYFVPVMEVISRNEYAAAIVACEIIIQICKNFSVRNWNVILVTEAICFGDKHTLGT